MDIATFMTQIAVCAVGTFYLVRGARDVFPDILAPEPSTKKSRGLTFFMALFTGMILGGIGFAPNLIDKPWGAAVSGLIIGALVFGGAKIPGTQKMRLEDKGRLGKKRKITREEAKAAGLTTGQMKALDIGEPTPVPKSQ